jgi:hypothetical protein
MADFDDFDFSNLVVPAPAPPLDELAALLGEIESAEGLPVAPTVPGAGAEDTAAIVAAPQIEGPAWNRAKHLLPDWAIPLMGRYPSIGRGQSTRHGLVLWCLYLEDTEAGLLRNFKIGNDVFFHAAELELIEPDTQALGCRVVLKAFPFTVGTRVRFWESMRGTQPGTRLDTPGKSGAYLLTEQGLKRFGGKPSR